jgi:hypothetical protein
MNPGMGRQLIVRQRELVEQRNAQIQACLHKRHRGERPYQYAVRVLSELSALLAMPDRRFVDLRVDNPRQKPPCFRIFCIRENAGRDVDGVWEFTGIPDSREFLQFMVPISMQVEPGTTPRHPLEIEPCRTRPLALLMAAQRLISPQRILNALGRDVLQPVEPEGRTLLCEILSTTPGNRDKGRIRAVVGLLMATPPAGIENARYLLDDDARLLQDLALRVKKHRDPYDVEITCLYEIFISYSRELHLLGEPTGPEVNESLRRLDPKMIVKGDKAVFADHLWTSLAVLRDLNWSTIPPPNKITPELEFATRVLENPESPACRSLVKAVFRGSKTGEILLKFLRWLDEESPLVDRLVSMARHEALRTDGPLDEMEPVL